MKNVLVILGTRPEAIKLAPVILELRKAPRNYQVTVCNTEQQKDLSAQALDFFDLSADINLNVMRPNQTLNEAQQRLIDGLSEVFARYRKDATLVQGDTLTAFCGATASFCAQTPIFHVEAGLRSGDLRAPFPEEGFRQMIARVTDVHFAPTESARAALLKENLPSRSIFVTGNTVIDALSCLSARSLDDATRALMDRRIDLHSDIVLVTVHRRENHGQRLLNVLTAIESLANAFPAHQFVFPVHPNPNVKGRVESHLTSLKNVILTEALPYPQLVALMRLAKLVMTDSGGIQEEAPTFGCPVLVLRHETERMEGVESGFADLVGTQIQTIVSAASAILRQDKAVTRKNALLNPYGDGKASQRIRHIMDAKLLG